MSNNVTIPDAIARTIVDPQAYALDDPINESFTWLRRNNPLGKVEIEGFAPFWAATSYHDIREIGAKNDVFHSGDLPLTLTTKIDDEAIREASGGKPYLARAVIQMDPPDHRKYRSLTNAWFAPNNVRKISESIRGIASASIDAMAQKGRKLDFVSDVALHFPLRVIMAILGVPSSDEAFLLRLTQEVFAPQDPEIYEVASEDPAIISERQKETYAQFFAYFSDLYEARRATPRDDLASVIANSQVDGRPINAFEAASYYIIIATAGHDTTSSSIAGTIWALCENPGAFAKVKADTRLIPAMVDEGVRWTTPVKHFMRSACQDVEISGRTIREGDWLMLCYLSGNRDESVFDHPFEFRVDRTPNRHLAFGYGAHVCLGQYLAKLEMAVLFEEFFKRVRKVEFAGIPTRSWATFVNGPRHLPLAITMD